MSARRFSVSGLSTEPPWTLRFQSPEAVQTPFVSRLSLWGFRFACSTRITQKAPGSGDRHAGQRPVIPKLRSTSKPPSDRAVAVSRKAGGGGQRDKHHCQKSS